MMFRIRLLVIVLPLSMEAYPKLGGSKSLAQCVNDKEASSNKG